MVLDVEGDGAAAVPEVLLDAGEEHVHRADVHVADGHIAGTESAGLDLPLLGQQEVEAAVEALDEGTVGVAAFGAGVAVVGGEVVGREVEPFGYGQFRDGQGRSGEGLGTEIFPDETLLSVVRIDFGTLHDEVGVVLVEQA